MAKGQVRCDSENMETGSECACSVVGWTPTSSLPPHPCAPQTLPLRVCKKEEKKPVCPQNTKAGVLYDLGIKEQIHE